MKFMKRKLLSNLDITMKVCYFNEVNILINYCLIFYDF